ncbi:unnamed protein product [Durusdinium trenchii]|uniref:Uncharacterized protein n=1 Tax=Durusdinium trenchii TaxID=1381693 RepID=A0ABP0MKB3_9DINO
MELSQAADEDRFIVGLRAALVNGFQEARRTLASVNVSGLFALSCLVRLMHLDEVGDWRPQVASLLVDFGPGTDRVDQAEEFFAELARLPSGLKILTRALKAWNVQCAEQLSKELRELLVSSVLRDAPTPRTALAAVTLGGLPGLLPPEASKSVLETADDGSRDEAIELMAKGLALESQRFLVQLRQEHGRAKAAAKAVQVLGLEEEFPDAEFHWKKEALESAICKGRREAMVGLSCQESRLHSRCVQGLLECNEVELAADLGMTWNVALPELSEKLKEAKMKREAECFSLPEAVSINLVEDEVAVGRLSLLSSTTSSTTIGFDLECNMASGVLEPQRQILLKVLVATEG